MQPILPFLPARIREMIEKLPKTALDALEEIRIREARSLEIVHDGESRFVTEGGALTVDPEAGYKPAKEDCAKLLDLLTNHSLYTFEEELRRGYITIAGGHRVGLAGKTVLERGEVKHIRDVAGFNIRIARAVRGVGAALLPAIWDESAGSVHQTLVISPPRQGKTTLVRDLARMISAGSQSVSGRDARRSQLARSGLRVGIVDERSEIAACYRGVPTFDVGPRTDVLDGCPKAEGMMMMIRSMSPDVLVVDEIGRPEDAAALQEALHAGVRVIATAHGRSVADVRDRPVMRRLLEERMFARLVELSRNRQAGARFTVWDANGNKVAEPAAERLREAGGTPC
ncbi:stage III sporulation protein AA [Paenibacillus flagellatus]|uniref:Stage III sporulation protein AA n=1 Tax=Paenibacillus flagellatus TaxID=2211139 RepID=A0A2V5KAF3_9BACL|nr:stage III sporulation protein AA [Paenibacillus flagellatus]PYI55064.1 stage III sporulation protein AA [Paenibacillus flagellatus]